MVVRPVCAAASVLTVRVAPSRAGDGERVTDTRLEVRLRRVEATADSAGGRARAHPRGEHGTVPVIFCVVVPRPVEGAAALVVSVRTVIVRSLPAVRAAAVRETERDTTEKGTHTHTLRIGPDPWQALTQELKCTSSSKT